MIEAAPVRDAAAQDQYRPLSGLAMASLLLSLASPLIYLVREPWMIMMLVAPALVLALIARRRIRKSEGTLAGHSVAGAALAISLVVGLSFATKHFTEYWIIRYESEQFIDRWFTKAREGREGQVFMDCITPEMRKIPFSANDIARLRAQWPSPTNPNDNQYDTWRKLPLPNVLFRYRDRVTWEHLGIAEWSSGADGHVVTHRFRVVSPEFDAVMLLKAISQVTDGPSGPRREWRVDAGNAQFDPKDYKQTQYGDDLRDAKAEASRALEKWIAYLIHGPKESAEKVLVKPTPPDVLTSVERIRSTATRSLTRQQLTEVKLRDSYMINDLQDKNTWLLDFHGVLDAGPREVEFRLQLRTDDLAKGPEGWVIASAKFHGERKKLSTGDPEDMRAVGAKRLSSGALPTDPVKGKDKDKKP
jgi:hypothetical protein